MMAAKCTTSASEFLELHLRSLECNIAENNMLINVCSRDQSSEGFRFYGWYETGGSVVLHLVYSPSMHKLLVSYTGEDGGINVEDAASAILTKFLSSMREHKSEVPITGMIGEYTRATLCAAALKSAHTADPNFILDMDLLVYKPNPAPIGGQLAATLHPFKDGMVDGLSRLVENFYADTGVAHHTDPRARAQGFISEHSAFYTGSSDDPTCAVGFNRVTKGMCRIVFVYTPDKHRGRGHAKAAVAMLSQQLMEGMHTEDPVNVVALYADKSKPYIGNMYRSVGFVDKARFVDLKIDM